MCALRTGHGNGAGELFTIEKSHGRPRLTAPRLTDLGTVPTAQERSQNHTAKGTFADKNKAAVGRSAKAAVRKPYGEAEGRISAALVANTEPSASDRLLADALAVFHAARRELGSGSAFVQGPTIAYAAETILAGYFMSEAAQAGFLTDRGMQLHERAMACETQAARAMTAALAATKALGGRKTRRRATPSYLIADGDDK